MKRYVIDSYSLVAYAEGQKGAKEVAEVFKNTLLGKAEIFLCVISWGEMYSLALRDGGKEKAELFKNIFARYPITIVEANKELTLQAAQYKATHKITFANAYVTALVKSKNAILITGDKDFKVLENEIKISWI